nr:2-succinyl-5-enolpyruvyl-6-hydroxy-3-cyclohexene-1-carboxylic-acid synthase [Petropleomorpha daqingensis]
MVDELVRGGVTDAVLAPGSRSAPVALALAAAERTGRLRLHVRIDERTAAFLALGLAKASGRPVPVLTTSGTATAHLHAAVLEADASGVPLVALTADRPPELRATGANQTIEQTALYGGAVRWAADVGVPEAGREQAQNRYWRSVVSRALLVARGELSADPGPVHLNLPLREPLLPDDEPGELTGPWAGRDGGAAWTGVRPRAGRTTTDVTWSPRTLLVAGDGPASWGRIAAENVERFWPVVAEPSSGAWISGALRGGVLLLGAREWLDEHLPDRVVVLGRPTLSRPVSALLADPRVEVEVTSGTARWADAARSATTVGVNFSAGPGEGGPHIDGGWAREWAVAADRVGAAVDAVLDAAPALSAARLARDLVAALPAGSLLVLGSSTPVRDVDRLAVPRGDVTVLANRGVAGIDGTISTAIGAAAVHGGRAFALLGDLTFLHDATGLLVGEGESRPDLTVVVRDDDGGGIFAQLEPGEDRHATDYRRVFGTPHGRDLVAVAEAMGWPATAVSTPDELRAALALGGPRVVVVRTDQREEARLARELRDAAVDALR